MLVAQVKWWVQDGTKLSWVLVLGGFVMEGSGAGGWGCWCLWQLPHTAASVLLQ